MMKLAIRRRLLLSLCLAAAVWAVAADAYAQSAPASTVEGALEAHFAAASDDAAANALRDAGYRYHRLLIAEMLPSQSSLVVEVELTRDDTRLRYPVKLARQLDDDRIIWTVDWSPVVEYARALTDTAADDGLTDIGTESPAWADLERLPAFPVIVDAEAFVTPYGRVARPQQPTGGDARLAVPEELGEHAQRWIGLTLEDEPGMANIDLILTSRVSWTNATQALMAPASVGLFRTYLVGEADGAVGAIATAAPVVREQKEGASPLVVGMYRADDQQAFRARLGDDILAVEGACAEQMTFCSSTIDTFEQKVLDKLVDALQAQPAKIAYVMFAATGDHSAGEVAAYLTGLGDALGVDAARIFVGYIGAEQ